MPEDVSARVPAEQREPGRDRDAVRLLVSRGTEVAQHAFDELPRRAGDLLPERFAVPEASARLIDAVIADREEPGARPRRDVGRGRAGGRVVAVGTTAVRAVESTDADGVVSARDGWTDLVLTPERGVRVVDGLLTGLHGPEASHLLMPGAVAGREAVDCGHGEALHERHLWHEFGDVHLIVPALSPHREHCSSN